MCLICCKNERKEKTKERAGNIDTNTSIYMVTKNINHVNCLIFYGSII